MLLCGSSGDVLLLPSGNNAGFILAILRVIFLAQNVQFHLDDDETGWVGASDFVSWSSFPRLDHKKPDNI